MKKKFLLYYILSIVSLSLLGQSTVVTSYGTGAGTGGNTNAFFGGSAGRVTTGANNSFLGPNTGYFNTTGHHNTFIGNGSGWFNTTGASNIGLGDGGNYNNSTGSSNIAIGNSALFANTSSSNNTALGNGAGYNALGSGNVFLGFNAGSNETGSNKLYIANSGTSPLIYGNFSTGSVGIGTSASDGFQINAAVSETAQSTSNIRMGVNAGAPRLIFDMAGSSPFQIDNSGGQLRIFNPGVVRMVVNGNGNVGIGTTSPAYKLDVSGSINASSILINGQPFAGGGSQWATSGASINYPGGNVGIGTASPAYKLDVGGIINATGIYLNGQPFSPSSIWGSSANTTFYTSGNVGIGTSTPTTRLEVKMALPSQATYDAQLWSTENAGYNLRLQQVWDQNGISQRIIQKANGVDYTALTFLNGNAGIGTTNPLYKLDVGGSINASSILINGQPFAGGGSQWATSGTSINYPGGNVGIGTAAPDAKLAVKGQIHANEVKVDLSVPGPDYVFEKSYALPTLEEVKTYIDTNKHLPEIPSAKEMEKNGVQLGEMNMLLLKKIEELTLYVIELKKENIEQNKLIHELKDKAIRK